MSKTMEPKTLKEIAELEGVSHQMITIILERALRKFLKELNKRGIKLEDLV